MLMVGRVALVTLTCLVFAPATVQPAAHGQHKHHGSGERLEDGAFSPRDQHHHEGDHHDVEFDHEAILGSKKEAYDFDKLSPHEAKKRLRLLLEKMDRNGDKQIERQELYAWILRSFKSLSKEESDERFDDSDTDEDGKITWKEYVAEEFDLEDNEGMDVNDPMYEEELQLMEEDRMLFNAADKDKDGSLNRAEFLAFSHPEEDDTMKPLVIDQVLNARDKNKDGLLSFQEYLGERGEGKDKEWLLTEKDRFDQELDRDGDHHLSREEILAWIIPSNEDTATEEVNHLFAGADQDVDGLLSFQEIVDNHDLFVGSEATDYGDHLANIDKFKDEL